MSLRVRAPLGQGDVRRGMGDVNEDPYMSRLVKLVPAEAVGPYPFLMDYAEKLTPHDGSARWAVYFVAWVLLIIVLVVRWQSTHEAGKGAQWGAILIAAVAFFIWVHVMHGDFGFELLLNKIATPVPADASRGIGDVAAAVSTNVNDLKQFVANVMLMAWTTLAPVVYRGEDAH